MKSLLSSARLSSPTPAYPVFRWRWLIAPLSLGIGIVLWEALARWQHLPAFILPTPLVVARRFGEVLANGLLPYHTFITLIQVLAGLGLGLVVALPLGYAIAKSATLEQALNPYIVASQAIPIVAIAPLLVIWFGSGLASKVIVSALIVFFPILVNTVVGLRAVAPELRELFRSLQASRWQTFAQLEVPAALPVLLGGLKIGATLAVIGAVVGEFVGSDRGLGFLINLGRGQYDTALVFVAIGTLVALALTLYGLVVLLEKQVLRWKRE